MPKRLIALLAILISLTGCILQSPEPAFSDGDGRLALGPSGGVFFLFSRRDGTWVKDAETMALQREGRHYNVSGKTPVMALTFIPLAGAWHVLQATEQGKPAAYMLASVKDGSADIYPLGCSDLKRREDLGSAIRHDGDDCFIREDTDAMALFLKLVATPGEASARMVKSP